jgi:hypothetical protein
MSNPNFTEIVATTLQGYSGVLADNISKSNALLSVINEKGNKQTATGRTIVQELEYGENSTVMWYSGSETLNISPGEVFTAAEFNYKQLAGNVVVNGLEEIQNSGKEAVHNLVKSRIKNLEKSLKNTVASAIYGDGTAASGKAIGGLRLLVSDAGTGTVGGINAATYAWWANKVYDFSAKTITASKDTIQAAMNDTYIRLTRGADKPDVWVADKNYYTFYLESLQAQQRFTDDKKAGAGFLNLKFMGSTVFYDDQCPTDHMYALNTDYIFLRPAKGREFVPLGEKSSVNQDALVMPVVWAGNMTVSNRGLQGVICA